MAMNPRRPRGLPGRGVRTAALWGVVVGVLSVSACGGGSSGNSSGSAPSATLPGLREFGLTDQQFVDHVERTQGLIAECMTAAGFEYVPVDVKSIEAAQKRVRLDPDFPRVEYKQRWGYGASTRFDDPVRDIGLGPNLQILNGLSDADRVAYSRTLWGDNPDADFAFTLDEEDFSETEGCTRKAIDAVFTPEQISGSYVNPKDVLVESDPRIVAARKKWSECMQEKGYAYLEDQDEIIDEYEERFAELVEGDDPTTLTGARAEALKKLQQEEIAAALADVDCEIKHTDKIFEQVEIEVFGHKVA